VVAAPETVGLESVYSAVQPASHIDSLTRFLHLWICLFPTIRGIRVPYPSIGDLWGACRKLVNISTEQSNVVSMAKLSKVNTRQPGPRPDGANNSIETEDLWHDFLVES